MASIGSCPVILPLKGMAALTLLGGEPQIVRATNTAVGVQRGLAPPAPASRQAYRQLPTGATLHRGDEDCAGHNARRVYVTCGWKLTRTS